MINQEEANLIYILIRGKVDEMEVVFIDLMKGKG